MNFEKLKNYLFQHQIVEDLDQLSIGLVDFKKNQCEKLCLSSMGKPLKKVSKMYFLDLASLTKPFNDWIDTIFTSEVFKSKKQ